MDDSAVGRAFRAVRVRKRLRQVDLARSAGVSQTIVSRIERGKLTGVPIGTLRRVADALGMKVALEARWEGAALDRLLGSRHSAMHEAVARMFEAMPDWLTQPEVTFAFYADRGSIDILAWHAASRTLLVIELKTEIVDVQETVAVLDKKVRNAPKIAEERGWKPLVVARWLIVADSATNRRRVSAHRAMLRAAFPIDGRSMPGWLAAPDGPVAALSFLASSHSRTGTRGMAAVYRVRRHSKPSEPPRT
jgi:transcriptional regulator with XRE-family HTH domain